VPLLSMHPESSRRHACRDYIVNTSFRPHVPICMNLQSFTMVEICATRRKHRKFRRAENFACSKVLIGRFAGFVSIHESRIRRPEIDRQRLSQSISLRARELRSHLLLLSRTSKNTTELRFRSSLSEELCPFSQSLEKPKNPALDHRFFKSWEAINGTLRGSRNLTLPLEAVVLLRLQPTSSAASMSASSVSTSTT